MSFSQDVKLLCQVVQLYDTEKSEAEGVSSQLQRLTVLLKMMVNVAG